MRDDIAAQACDAARRMRQRKSARGDVAAQAGNTACDVQQARAGERPRVVARDDLYRAARAQWRLAEFEVGRSSRQSGGAQLHQAAGVEHGRCLARMRLRTLHTDVAAVVHVGHGAVQQHWRH